LNKLTLKYEIDLDFILIAITSPLKDYRLCYFINKFTKLQLAKKDDYLLTGTRESQTLKFSFFQFFTPHSETEFHLISNKGIEGGYLVPEMLHFDYFLIIKNFIDDEDLELLESAIHSIPDVLVASKIAPEKLKSKENLIF
jgi:hypothetical protein